MSNNMKNTDPMVTCKLIIIIIIIHNFIRYIIHKIQSCITIVEQWVQSMVLPWTLCIIYLFKYMLDGPNIYLKLK